MYTGNYNFFDYKYNIIGYDGQDYGSFAQYFYLVASIILMIILLISLRKLSKEKVIKIVKILSMFLIFFYIAKTTWESYYDIKLSGAFNYYLLPFDTCSMIMFAGLLASFTKGKISNCAYSWLATGGVLGGFATMIFLNAFKYYPFLSFGAFYSMIWHFLMVFIGLLLIVTKTVDIKYSTILKGFIFHVIVSLIVIPIDYIFNFDFMMYKDLGSIPFFEDIATKFTNMNLSFINPFMMLALYFVAFNIIFLIPMGISKIVSKKKKTRK